MLHFVMDDHKTYKRAYAKLLKAMDAQNRIAVKNTTITNIANKGIGYLLVYYLLCKHRPPVVNYDEIVIDAFEAMDEVLASARLTAVEVKSFATFALIYRTVVHPIASNIYAITRSQMMNSTDLAQPIWSVLYIHSILQHIPLSKRKHFLLPALDWGFVRTATKHFFTTPLLTNQAKFGENIHFIGVTAQRQLSAIDSIGKTDESQSDVDTMKHLATSLKENATAINYTLDDVAMVMFYEEIGASLAEERTHDWVRPIFGNHDQLRHFVLQYLYALFLLTEKGIVHNDVHFQNILLTRVEPSEERQKFTYDLPNGKTVQMGAPIAYVTLINFDKAILSRHHHDFADSAKQIEKDVATALKMRDKKMTGDYDVVFSCYAMYDVLKLCLHLRMHLDNIREQIIPVEYKKSDDWLATLLKAAVGILHKLFSNDSLPFDHKDTHASMQWLIETTYPIKITEQQAVVQTPEFISSRRKRANILKTEFVAQYASSQLN